MLLLTALLTALPFVLQASAKKLPPEAFIIDEIVKSAKVIANITDPRVTRDGLVSTKIAGTRTLWTAGDTMLFDLEKRTGVNPMVVNTASWSDTNADGSPKIITNGPVGCGSNGSNPILLLYGSPWVKDRTPFYPLDQPNACKPPRGKCADGSRTVLWMESAPMVTSSDPKGRTVAYTWVANWHLLDLAPVGGVTEPSYSLYKMTYDNTQADRAQLPVNKLVDAAFYKAGQLGYGSYGRVVRGGYAYLYGQDQWRNTGVARVPVGHVENQDKYQYFVNNAWTAKRPAIDDVSRWALPNAGGKQGKYYYSDYFNRFVWIGARNASMSADFWMSTAPKAEGPWKNLTLIYRGEKGDAGFGAYSLQAHPALLKDRKERGIYLSFTQAWNKTTSPGNGVVTPLIYVAFN